MNTLSAVPAAFVSEKLRSIPSQTRNKNEFLSLLATEFAEEVGSCAREPKPDDADLDLSVPGHPEIFVIGDTAHAAERPISTVASSKSRKAVAGGSVLFSGGENGHETSPGCNPSKQRLLVPGCGSRTR